MGVRLELDLRELALGPAIEERELLEKARAGNVHAGAQLLLRYEDGELKDSVVKSFIVKGQSLVTRHIASEALRPAQPNGRSKPVNVRMFFIGLNAKGPTSTKPDPDGRIATLMRHGFWLTKSDALEALGDRPNKMHRVEKKMIQYVQKTYPGVSESRAREYVHRSFQWPWDQRDAEVSYPQ